MNTYTQAELKLRFQVIYPTAPWSPNPVFFPLYSALVPPLPHSFFKGCC